MQSVLNSSDFRITKYIPLESFLSLEKAQNYNTLKTREQKHKKHIKTICISFFIEGYLLLSPLQRRPTKHWHRPHPLLVVDESPM